MRLDKGLFSGVLREPLEDTLTVLVSTSESYALPYLLPNAQSTAARRVGALGLSSVHCSVDKVHDA